MSPAGLFQIAKLVGTLKFVKVMLLKIEALIETRLNKELQVVGISEPSMTTPKEQSYFAVRVAMLLTTSQFYHFQKL